MTTKKPSCKCHPDSPFLWMNNPRKSIFIGDLAFRATKEGETFSQVSSRSVDTQRAKGTNAGYLKGISKNREAEILRMRTFHMFSMARKQDEKDDGPERSG